MYEAFSGLFQNFKQATIINVLMLLAGVLLYFDMNICRNIKGTLSQVLLVIFTMILVIYIMIFMYIYPVLAKFYNTIKNTLINAFLMSVRHLPYTILMVLISAAPVALLYFIQNGQTQLNILMVLILIGFSGVAYLNSFFFVKIFDKYVPKEEPEAGAQIEENAKSDDSSSSDKPAL